jgi:hypothetical protein
MAASFTNYNLYSKHANISEIQRKLIKNKLTFFPFHRLFPTGAISPFLWRFPVMIASP